MTARDDIKAAFDFAARVAIDQHVSKDDLTSMLHSSCAEAAKIDKQRIAKGAGRVGSFVNYWDEKKGLLSAHVLDTCGGGRLSLRVHRTAQPDFDVSSVPYSVKPAKGHWSHR